MKVEAKIIQISISLTPEELGNLRDDLVSVLKIAAESPYGDLQQNDVLVKHPSLIMLLDILKPNPFDLPF